MVLILGFFYPATGENQGFEMLLYSKIGEFSLKTEVRVAFSLNAVAGSFRHGLCF